MANSKGPHGKLREGVEGRRGGHWAFGNGGREEEGHLLGSGGPFERRPIPENASG